MTDLLPPTPAQADAANTAAANDPNTVKSIIIRVANELGVDPQLALAIAQQESGFDPNSIGDNGHSVGLFQLNDQGEGAGMTVAQRQDPETNARIALTQVAAVAKAHPDWSPGQIAAAAQRPRDQVAYSAAIDGIMGQPGGSGAGAATLGSTPAPSTGVAPDVPYDPNSQYAITPQAEQWLKANNPDDAWMLSMPGTQGQELRNILGYIGANHVTNTATIQGLIDSSQWFRTHDAAQRGWQQTYATKPQDAARAIQTSKATIMTQAKQAGVTLTDDQLNTLAINDNYYGWTPQELNYAISSYLPAATQPTAGGAAQVEFQALKAKATQTWGVPTSDQQIEQWVVQISAGMQTEAGVDALLKQQATSLYPTLSDQFARGFTFAQATDPYKQIAAQYLNVDPNTINFTDPKWMAALSQVDQKTGQRTEMGLDAWTNKIRSDPSYGYQNTNMGKNEMVGLANSAAKALGVIAP